MKQRERDADGGNQAGANVLDGGMAAPLAS
jgi:hypothetical protein